MPLPAVIKENPLAKRIGKIFAGQDNPPRERTTEDIDAAEARQMQSMFLDRVKELFSSTTNRISRYKDYEMMDGETLPSRALDILASLTTLGEIDEDETASTYKVVTKNPRQKKIFDSLELRLDLKRNLYQKVRTMFKFGLNAQELVWQEYTGLVKMRYIAPGSFKFTNEQDPGEGEFPYQQVDPSGNQLARFRKFQVALFMVEGDESRLYGKSMLEGVRKTFKILDILETSLVFREINRSLQKWLWLVDATGLDPDSAAAYAKKIAGRYQKPRYIDAKGNINLSSNIFRDMGDIALPTFKEGGLVDIKPLPSDGGQPNTKVLEHYLSKFFGGLGIPNHYFSIEGARQIRSAAAMSYADLMLARQVYRLQTGVVSVLWDVYHRESQFHGIDDSEFKLILPVLATVDELRKMQIYNLKLQCAKTLRIDMRLVDDEWVYNFLKFKNEDIARLKGFREIIRKDEQAMTQAAADGVFLQPVTTMGNEDGPNPFDVITPVDRQDIAQETNPFTPASESLQISAEERQVLQERMNNERLFASMLKNGETASMLKDIEDFTKWRLQDGQDHEKQS